jgi:hypothetical protein
MSVLQAMDRKTKKRHPVTMDKEDLNTLQEMSVNLQEIYTNENKHRPGTMRGPYVSERRRGKVVNRQLSHLFLGIDYASNTRLHYRDGNALNLTRENIVYDPDRPRRKRRKTTRKANGGALSLKVDCLLTSGGHRVYVVEFNEAEIYAGMDEEKAKEALFDRWS